MPMDDVDENAAEDDDDKDDRKPQRIWDKHVAPETELSDSCVAPPPPFFLPRGPLRARRLTLCSSRVAPESDDREDEGQTGRKDRRSHRRSRSPSASAKGKERAHHELVPPLPPPSSSSAPGQTNGTAAAPTPAGGAVNGSAAPPPPTPLLPASVKTEEGGSVAPAPAPSVGETTVPPASGGPAAAVAGAGERASGASAMDVDEPAPPAP